jgi:rubrerythrin
MKLSPKAPASRVLALGIKSEVEAAHFYAALRRKVKNQLLQKKLDFLILEERQHRKILERLFRERFGPRKIVLPASSFMSSLAALRPGQLTVKGLFEEALKSEKLSEDFYARAASAAGDAAGRHMLVYLSRVERSHYFMIKSEIDLLARFPDYYEVEEFHIGQDMIHVGP